jgi:hypothetical protein
MITFGTSTDCICKCTHTAVNPWQLIMRPTQVVRGRCVPRAAWTRADVGRAGSLRVALCGVIRPARRHQQATMVVHRAHTRRQTHGNSCIRRRRCENTTSPGRCGRGRAVGRAGSRRVAPCGVIRPMRRHQQVTMVVHRAHTCNPCIRRRRCENTTSPGRCGRGRAVGRAGSRRVAPCGSIRPARAVTPVGDCTCVRCIHNTADPWQPVHPTQAVRKHGVTRAVWPGAGLGSRWITARGPVRRHPTCAATPAGNGDCAPCTDMAQTPLRCLLPTWEVGTHGVPMSFSGCRCDRRVLHWATARLYWGRPYPAVIQLESLV